jgi:CDGSH-type Zn-finger protein
MSPHQDEVTLTLYRDGPIVLRGPFTLRDQEGTAIDVGRRTVALCRCGASRRRPFCDGTHKIARFTAPFGDDRSSVAAPPAPRGAQSAAVEE